jgi:D-glucosaminate-6-phosphate ammonia-lyase
MIRQDTVSAILKQLGIKPVINGKGTSTRLGGANLSPDVMQAMAEAAKCSIDAFDLQVAASRVIADVTGAEAGMVTTGASAGLLLASAAALAGLDVGRMNKLPDDPGPKNQILVAKSHRNFYDRALLMPGARLCEVGVSDRVTGAGVRDVETWEFEDAIDEHTAAIFYVATSAAAPPLEDVIGVAHRRAVPVIVDAAAQLPPKENLRRYIGMGADLVVFSGGKVIQGPPGTGVLCGRRDLIASAILQSLDTDIDFRFWRGDDHLVPPGSIRGLPRHGVGRSCKVGKEEAIGLLAALKAFDRDGIDPWKKEWQSMATALQAGLEAIADLSVEYLENSYRPGIPGVTLTSRHRDPNFARALATFLRDFDPPIFLDQGAMDGGVLKIASICLRPSDVPVIIGAVKSFCERKNDRNV